MANNLENNSWEHNISHHNKQGRDDDRNATSYEESKIIDAALQEHDSTRNHHINKLCLTRGMTIKTLRSECNKLQEELNKTVVELDTSRKVFRAVTGELKKQLETANRRESESQTKALSLRLENEKLQVLLESKNGLVEKLKKELLNAKRVLKIAIKDICSVSRVSDVTFSDMDYEEFESSLRSSRHARSPRSPVTPRSPRVRFADSLDNDIADYNSLKNSQEPNTI